MRWEDEVEVEVKKRGMGKTKGGGGDEGHLQSDPEGPGRLANDLRCSVSSGRREKGSRPLSPATF